MSRAEEVDAILEDLYAQVPNVACKGLCTDSCGPIDAGHRELVRLRRAEVRLPPWREAVRQLHATGDYACPALADGHCSAYEVRPAICRVWGASEDLPCPYGCKPPPGERLLTSAQTLAIVDGARHAGTTGRALTAEEFEQRLADPAIRRHHREHIPIPVATQPIPRKAKQ